MTMTRNSAICVRRLIGLTCGAALAVSMAVAGAGSADARTGATGHVSTYHGDAYFAQTGSRDGGYLLIRNGGVYGLELQQRSAIPGTTPWRSLRQIGPGGAQQALGSWATARGFSAKDLRVCRTGIPGVGTGQCSTHVRFFNDGGGGGGGNNASRRGY